MAKYKSIRIISGGERIQIWGLSDGSIIKLDGLAKKMDGDMTKEEYCKNVLRKFAHENLNQCQDCTLKDKIESLRKKFDQFMSESAYCKMILLDHLKEN
jgi:hypothetical protein